MILVDLQPKFQPDSKNQKIIDGLQPYNQYQNVIDESQSQQIYQTHIFLKIKPSTEKAIDKLINTLEESILKHDELFEWYKKTIDEIKLTNEGLKKSNEEMEKFNEEMKKSNEEMKKSNDELKTITL